MRYNMYLFVMKVCYTELCFITNIYNILIWGIRVVYQDVNLTIRRTSQMSHYLSFLAMRIETKVVTEYSQNVLS